RDRGSKCLRIVGGRSSWVEVEWWMRASYSMPPMPSKTGAKRASADLNSVIDPRFGDIENDASSTQRRSLLSLAGRMLVEISFAKLVVAWGLLLILPGLLIGLAPMLISSWLIAVTNKIVSLVIGVGSGLLAGLPALGWF